jgi:hypothetical protein
MLVTELSGVVAQFTWSSNSRHTFKFQSLVAGARLRLHSKPVAAATGAQHRTQSPMENFAPLPPPALQWPQDRAVGCLE